MEVISDTDGSFEVIIFVTTVKQISSFSFYPSVAVNVFDSPFLLWVDISPRSAKVFII